MLGRECAHPGTPIVRTTDRTGVRSVMIGGGARIRTGVRAGTQPRRRGVAANEASSGEPLPEGSRRPRARRDPRTREVATLAREAVGRRRALGPPALTCHAVALIIQSSIMLGSSRASLWFSQACKGDRQLHRPAQRLLCEFTSRPRRFSAATHRGGSGPHAWPRHRSGTPLEDKRHGDRGTQSPGWRKTQVDSTRRQLLPPFPRISGPNQRSDGYQHYAEQRSFRRRR